MKPARLVVATLAVGVACAWAASALACDRNKTTQASAASKSGVCTPEMAASCTPEMAAACKAKGAAAATAAATGTRKAHPAGQTAAAGGCPYHQTAVTAAYSGPSKTSAVVAGAGACSHGTAAVTAGSGQCASKGSSASAGDAGSCSGWGVGRTAGKVSHGDCDACADIFSCDQEITAAGARIQTVSLKNGVMFVYTAESPRAVNAVQSAIARRFDRLAQFQKAGDKAHLCAECKSMRGAVASGRLSREVVNIEGGALTLMTSDDPKIVAKIHALMDTGMAARVKS